MASIRCRSGEKFPSFHTHSSVADVRKCQGAVSGWKTAESVNAAVDRTLERYEKRDPKNVYLNSNGINARAAHRPVDDADVSNAIARVKPSMVEVPGLGIMVPDTRRETTTGAPTEAYRANPPAQVRVDPELEAKVPAGRYAVPGEDGAIKFYRVEKPTQGTWAGRTFVKVRAGDDWHPIRYATARQGILRKIAEDVRAASMRYGLELGECGVCGRTLTNPESIAKGIGPVCEGRL